MRLRGGDDVLSFRSVDAGRPCLEAQRDGVKGLLAGLFEGRARTGESFHVSQTPPGWVDRWARWDTASGAQVDESTALQVMAVYACVRILAESVAALPLVLYQRLADGGKARARGHGLYEILHTAPNPELTSFELREVLMGHVALWGNGYAEIETGGGGQVLGLWPLRPDKMTVERIGGELVYMYQLPRPDAQGRTERSLRADQVLHIRGFGFDGLVGYSPEGTTFKFNSVVSHK